ncbi:hypothetical protein AN958_02543 [Leucoagaricus sp. SymC.cos]|nr:hypothetical protein AN958_02543 [Leucoagaricus sp. SymC.cos]
MCSPSLHLARQLVLPLFQARAQFPLLALSIAWAHDRALICPSSHLSAGYPAVHHSTTTRCNNRPSCRITTDVSPLLYEARWEQSRSNERITMGVPLPSSSSLAIIWNPLLRGHISQSYTPFLRAVP